MCFPVHNLCNAATNLMFLIPLQTCCARLRTSSVWSPICPCSSDITHKQRFVWLGSEVEHVKKVNMQLSHRQRKAEEASSKYHCNQSPLLYERIWRNVSILEWQHKGATVWKDIHMVQNTLHLEGITVNVDHPLIIWRLNAVSSHLDFKIWSP